MLVAGRLIQRVRYAQYLWAQVRQTRAKRHKDARFRLIPFVRVVKTYCSDLRPDASVLAIGPRNEIELDVLAEGGFTNVIGIDLYSRSSRVRRMDMHWLKFPDRSFDLVFASHVFEHAWDFGSVAREVMRVLKPAGYVFCAVPRAFEPDAHDRYRFDTSAGLLEYFVPGGPHILYEEVRPQELRLLFRLRGT
jgi:SAM-dependent methyltransferase